VLVRVEIHHPPAHLPWESVKNIYEDIWRAKDIIMKGEVQYAYDVAVERGFEAYVVSLSEDDYKQLRELAQKNKFYIKVEREE